MRQRSKLREEEAKVLIQFGKSSHFKKTASGSKERLEYSAATFN